MSKHREIFLAVFMFFGLAVCLFGNSPELDSSNRLEAGAPIVVNYRHAN